MRRMFSVLLVVAFLVLSLGCNETQNKNPYISNIEPSSGAPGIIVTLEGQNFNQLVVIRFVTFGYNTAETINWTDKKIVVRAPYGEGTVKVVVQGPAGRSNAVEFTYLKPIIDSISPSLGKPNTEVTIKGKRFGLPSEYSLTSYVHFGKSSARVKSWADEQIIVEAPSDYGTGENDEKLIKWFIKVAKAGYTGDIPGLIIDIIQELALSGVKILPAEEKIEVDVKVTTPAGKSNTQIFTYLVSESEPTPTPKPEVIKWVYETNSSPTCVAVSADGNYVAIGSSDKIYFLDSNKNLLWTYQTDYPITDVSLRANGSRVIASGLEEDIISDGAMYYLNNQGKLVSSIEPNGISSISLSPEGKYFAMTTVSGLGWNDEVALCGFNEGKWLWRRGFAMEETTSVSISTNGDYIAAGGSPGPTDNGGVRLYNKNGTLLWDYDEINKKELGYDKYSVSISSDGNYIAVGHEGEDNLYFFNKKGEVLWKYNTEKIKGVSISDNGDFIAAASSKKIYLLKRDGLNEPTLQWSFGLANIEDVSISGNAKLLAAATQDNKVYAFDLGGLLH